MKPEMLMLARAIATGVIHVAHGHREAPPLELPKPEDFKMQEMTEKIRYKRYEREPWRRGRPIK